MSFCSFKNYCKKREIVAITLFFSTDFIFSSKSIAKTPEPINSLETITISATADEPKSDKTESDYAGGQISSGGRIGSLGERSRLDVPFNVYSYTNKFIADQQNKTLADVVQNDASSSIGLAAGGYAEVFKIRGFTLVGDDISYGGLYGVLPRKMINTNLFERVEIFKGASAFTNGVPAGGSGVGGAINVEPKHAKDISITKINLAYENENYKSIQLDLGRRFGVDGEFGFRISGNHGQGDAVVKDADNKNTSVVLGLDYRGLENRASLDFGYQKDLINKGLMAVGLKDPNGPGWGRNYEGTQVPKPPKATQNYSPAWGFSNDESIFGMLRGEHDFSDAWIGYAAIGGSRHEEKAREASVDIINYEGDASTGQYLGRQITQSFASQFGVRGKFNTGQISHKLNLGYSSVFTRVGKGVLESEIEQFTNIYSPNKALNNVEKIGFGNINTELSQRVRNQGVSISDELGFLDDKFLVTAGFRYQKIENYDYANDQVVNLYKQTDITPIYGVVYKINDQLSLYANHIEALQVADNAPLDTESNRKNGLSLDNWGQSPGIIKSKQNELGINFDFGVLGGGVGLFQIKQPQAIVNIEGTHFDFYNEQTNKGVEFNLYGAPRKDIRVYSSLMILDAKLNKAEIIDYKEKKITGNPEHKLVIGGEMDIPYINDLTVTGRFISTGKQYINQSNNFKIDDWNKFDVGLRFITTPFKKGNVTWRANLENVFNNSYWASAAIDGNSRVTVGEPRTFKISATFDF